MCVVVAIPIVSLKIFLEIFWEAFEKLLMVVTFSQHTTHNSVCRTENILFRRENNPTLRGFWNSSWMCCIHILRQADMFLKFLKVAIYDAAGAENWKWQKMLLRFHWKEFIKLSRSTLGLGFFITFCISFESIWISISFQQNAQLHHIQAQLEKPHIHERRIFIYTKHKTEISRSFLFNLFHFSPQIR